MSNYVKNKEACKLLNVNHKTLYKWCDEGVLEYIRIGTGCRRYNIDKFLNKEIINKVEEKEKEPVIVKKKICYCRVSTYGQKDDLNRQVEFMMEKYPGYDVITDVGSGINYKRKGLLKIIKMGLKNELDEIVVAHKDRLCRFGFELIQFILMESSNCEIKILDNEKASPEKEIVNDLIQIITVFGARVNGLRKYKTAINKEKQT